MALYAYMRLTGATQGDIKGSVTRAGREDTIEVTDANHNISAPRDPASGLPTGKRMHSPLTIVKPIDKSSPILYNVLVRNEQVTQLRLDFYRPSAIGAEEQYYTIELVNGAISSTSFDMSGDGRDTEVIQFHYQKIIWTFQDGGITAEDDWEAPSA